MEETQEQECPICGRYFCRSLIETHVNKCIFLNTHETHETAKRKRTPSPSLLNKSSITENVISPKKKSNNLYSNDSVLNKPRQNSSSENYDFKEQKENKKVHPFFHNKLQSQVNSSLKNNEQSSSQCEANNQTQIEFKYENNKGNGKDQLFITPLPKQLQPKSLDDFVGQDHVFGENSMLRTLIKKGQIPNMILWGPPGCGKSSLASVIQGVCKNESKRLRYVSLCATDAGVKDVQALVTAAKNELKFGRQTVLFMDEIHRFNKKQQDTFLICVEKGEIILIGATTENPSFSLNNALLSRCRVIVFNKLENDSVLSILNKALENFDIDLIEENAASLEDQEVEKLSIEESALDWIASISDGDARIALTNLQLVLQHHIEKKCVLTTEDIKDCIKKSHLLYDRKEEEHYNLISALHKSIRASDPNAALYWLTRMTLAGEDPIYIARRMVRAASEDIGNSDPNALQLAISTMQGCHLLGMPECDVLLAQCAIYLARAPKSREADSALASAKNFIKNYKGPQPSVPMHLRNAPTRLMKDLGYGKLEEGASYTCMPEGSEDINFL